MAVRKKVGRGWVAFTEHALDGMEALGITRRQVLDVITAASECEIQSGRDDERENGRIQIKGEIDAGFVLIVLAANIEPEVVVVTAFWIEGDE